MGHARPRRPPLTYAEYRLLPEDDGKRYELMEGDLFVSPAPSTRHQTVSRRLQFALMQALELPGRAQVFDAPTDVLLDDLTVVQPDLVIVSAEHADRVTQRAIEGTPDVVIEIMSPSSVDRDAHLKLRVYEGFAIPEYWVIDPEHGFIEAFAFRDGGYQRRARYDRAMVLVCPLFPELSIPLAPIFK